MNTLLLSGHGISINVDGSKLHIQDGHDLNRPNPDSYVFKPKFIDLDNIVVYGHSGNISLDAIRWLTKQNVPLTVLNWDGRLLTSMMPLEYKSSNVRMAQYQAYGNGQRVDIAKKFIDAKIKNSIAVLEWLGKRYPEVAKANNERMKIINTNWVLMPKAIGIKDVMGIEGMVAHHYWAIVSTVFDKKMEFDGRVYGKTIRPMGAVDPINALFNYGYSILESQCWKALNSVGLDPHVGFMHEMNPSKAPLVYDFQEPFRWIVDVSVLSALEKKVFTKKDFIRTENYNIRIRPEGVKKLMAELMAQFTRKVQYQKLYREWGYIITEKAYELGQFIIGKRKSLDFSDPSPQLYREDSTAMRQKILNMDYSTWEKNGFSKGTLHYLKKNAKKDKPFKIYKNARKKLNAIGANI